MSQKNLIPSTTDHFWDIRPQEHQHPWNLVAHANQIPTSLYGLVHFRVFLKDLETSFRSPCQQPATIRGHHFFPYLSQRIYWEAIQTNLLQNELEKKFMKANMQAEELT